jgi:predicted metal-dependent phosphoesterase TrpH
MPERRVDPALKGGVDLHLHTTFSDGTERPERVVELAHQAGLSAIAITDHDNIDALPVATPVARRAGIELLPGVEMSASAGESDVHILGFCFDPANVALQRHLAEQQARRVERVHEMVERLKRVGVTITAQEVLEVAGDGTVGRPHVARVLLKHGYVSSFAEAFSKYIGDNGPGFVPGSPLSPARIIRVIRDAGGIPVLAHPKYLKRDALIDELVKEGLAGVEVYHSDHTPELVQHYGAIADRLKLLKTGGSDFHGNSKEGVPVGAVTVSYDAVEALKQWKATHSSPVS